jgi:putative DNA methylase
MSVTYKKKLIEVALPLEAINAASSREKSIRHGHPSTLHLWWARRPLAACRAVLFAQLVDDPSEHVDTLLADPKTRAAAEAELAKRVHAWEERQGDRSEDAVAAPKPTLSEVVADLERKRLFTIIEELVKWENSTNEEVLERARAEIRRSCGGELPPVYDPFSGGGSIPLEAQRLGLPAYGSDLNPVAVMIGKAMIEIPPKFRGMEPIHPGMPERNHYRNAEGLAEDVKYYGEWMRERALERIGHLYPEVDLPKEYGGGKATVIALIWARTVPSPDPAFSDVHVPLTSSFLLSAKKGKETWLEPLIDRFNKTISFRVRRGGTKVELAQAKTGTKAGQATFRCILSDAPISGDYADKAAARGEMGEMLLAMVVEGKSGRTFLDPDVPFVQNLVESAKEILPDLDASHLEIPCRGTFASNAQGRRYKFRTFQDYFTERQLVSLVTFSDLLDDVSDKITKDFCASSVGGDDDKAKLYADAVRVYLGFSINRLADRQSTLCGWDASRDNIRNTFARQAITMTWDFVEGNPFSNSTGNWASCVEWTSKVIAALVPSGSGKEIQHDAQTIRYPQGVVISTDPPYYDNIEYADLSDYFYVWARRSFSKILPELFGVISTPKAEELVATRYRHGGQEAADLFFLEGMKKVVRNMADQSSDLYPATIYYAFKQSEVSAEGVSSTGWATFLQAVVEAGYAVVGTWPMRTEMANRMIASGTNALANSVVLVCRKKEQSAETVTRAEFVRALKRELPPAIAKLQAANIAPADMPQSAIGPGMGVFSRYVAVLESDDSPMSVKTALQLINAELDTFLSSLTGDFDAETRFAVTWFEQFGYEKGEFGTAQSLCQARGLAVDAVKHAGIIESAAGKVRLLKRSELDDGWDPNTDPHLTVWECLQYLVRALDGGEENAARVLRKIGSDRAGAVKDLAYYLYDLAGNKRRDAQEATAYNALIALWSDLTGLAATVNDDAERQASLF